eukprot:scaffold28649_cov111-Isochrysis_galbana.AAC.7
MMGHSHMCTCRTHSPSHPPPPHAPTQLVGETQCRLHCGRGAGRGKPRALQFCTNQQTLILAVKMSSSISGRAALQEGVHFWC